MPTTCCFSCVDSGTVGVVQRFGEFTGIQEPGCSIICVPITTVTPCSLATQQLQCRSECKTSDNVTMSVVTAVQYRVQKDMVKTAVFDIVNPEDLMRAEVDNVLRSTLPTLSLDESYAAKEKMTTQVLATVKEAMGKFGYEIMNVLITDIQPEPKVLAAMNEINASRRQREAAYERGEAEKMLKIKSSEADAESKRLAGVGMAQMRAAMAQGFKDSIKFMTESGMSEQEAMHMMITTQYLDTLKEFSSSHGSIIVPHGPSAVKDIESQIREGFLTASSAPPSQQNMRGR